MTKKTKRNQRGAIKAEINQADAHALACFFYLHHASLALKGAGPRNIERIVMATFGLVTKTGEYKLTARGKRAVRMAKS